MKNQWMSLSFKSRGAAALAAVLVSGVASATSLDQNTSWTIQRPGAAPTYRLVAYGDSIYSGYTGSLFTVGRRAAPFVNGEYLSSRWGSHVEVVRRTRAGALARDVYSGKVVAERAYMQTSNTRVVMLEMCGNDYLQARSAFQEQTGTCDYSGMDAALANCTQYTERALQAINQYATQARVKVVSNLYYPGFDADDVRTACTDPVSGTSVHKRSSFLPYLVRGNWRTCQLAEQYGFQCADMFAEFMGADYDRNGDGVMDRDALRYKSGEPEADYVTRITATLASTLLDANTHFVDASTSYDYMQSDDTHPTVYLSAVLPLNATPANGAQGTPEFADGQIVGGRNPQWNKAGHERMGHANSLFTPASP
ncbi:MAG: SGNH/GDSL hydrolase family protein [Cystobacter sp.]